MLLATEDVVSEAVARKLIATIRPEFRVAGVVGNRGRGYIQSRARELNRTAHKVKVFILVDLCSAVECPADIRLAWFGTAAPAALFRMAVREVESWLLADCERFASMLAVPAHRIQTDTDSIADPKQFIVNLARRSRSVLVK